MKRESAFREGEDKMMGMKHKLRIAAIPLVLGLSAGLSLELMDSTVQTAYAAEETAETVAVTMSQDSGIYSDAFTLTLSAQGAAAVYYTLDGSDPTTSETRIEYTDAGIAITDRSGDNNYVSAVDPSLFDSANVSWKKKTKSYVSLCKAPENDAVDKGTVVKAVAVDASGTYGTVETNTYFVGTVAEHIKNAKQSAEAAGIPLSVMSISVSYEDLFDYETGIYVKGKTYDDAVAAYLEEYPNASSSTMNGLARDFAGNYSQKGKSWERSAHIDYFETDGETMDCKLQQDCGIRIQGNYSRSDLMKGFRLYARADYGKKNFKYAFFDDAKNDQGETITKHKKLVLRNGGNYAFSGTKYNDAYWQSLLTDLDCETQASRACVVYIDGEYWGLYILQQDFDDSYFEETHGVDKDTVAVYKASDAEEDAAYGYKLDEGTLPDGVTDSAYYYQELLAFFEAHANLKDEADYEAFCKLVDPQSVMDYFAAQVWINNKWDWPGKNWSMWRTTAVDESNPYADGRFRFCIYDLDFGGCGGSSEIYANTIRDDNYNTTQDEYGDYYNGKGLLGQNLKEPVNPALQCFILLMSNQSFRTAYEAELKAMADTNFESVHAVQKLDTFAGTYNPLLDQFYARYDWSNDYTNGYAGYSSLKEFVQGRGKGIASIISWVEDYYQNGKDEEPAVAPTSTPTVSPTSAPASSPTAAPTVAPSKTPAGSSVTAKSVRKSKPKLKIRSVKAKKRTKKVRIKTAGKANVTITCSKKIIYKGKKKAKKCTLRTSSNGKVTFRFAKKLKKGMKITITVRKSGYQTVKKTIRVA